MNNKSIFAVTVNQFVTALIENSPINHNPREKNVTIPNLLESHTHKHTSTKPEPSDYMHYGYHAGWLEDMDITGMDEPLLRKNAARIIHEFMRIELGEPDLEDVSCASKLRDLYDCRVCAGHVMQVYSKGIMEGYYASDTLYLFGMNEPVTLTEMNKIIFLVFEHKK